MLGGFFFYDDERRNPSEQSKLSLLGSRGLKVWAVTMTDTIRLLRASLKSLQYNCVFLGPVLKAGAELSVITDLADWQVFPRRTDHLHLNAIHQTLQLVAHVPGSSHGAELDKILVAPLSRVAALHPLRVTETRSARA